MMAILPGDYTKKEKLAELIRVNHAGEYGAKCIYAGQIAILKDKNSQELLNHMAQQEQQHLDFFSQKMQEHSVRPSFLLPIWHGIGYMLGAGTAMLGKNAAMICTQAVEEVIDKHYQEQINDKDLSKELSDKIEEFRQEEVEHLEIAQNNMNDLNLAHKILYHLIKTGCKISISIAKKI
jgi:3-demethoxyubiquinol 3-hydroxylase